MLYSAFGLVGIRFSHPFRQSSALIDRADSSLGLDAGRSYLSMSRQTGRSIEAKMDPRNWLHIQPVSARALMTQTSFLYSPSARQGTSVDSGVWTFWSQGNASGLANHPEDDFSLDGNVQSAYLGADYRCGQGPLLGLMLSHSAGAFDYASGINGDGGMDAHLTSLYPYVHWTPRTSMDVWALAGLGWGSAELADADSPFDAAIGMGMAALGGREHLGRHGRVNLAVKADWFGVRMQSEKAADTADTDAATQRVRLAVEGEGQYALSGGSLLRSTLEVGVRLDAGDAVTGQVQKWARVWDTGMRVWA